MLYPSEIFNRYDLRGSYPDEINETVAEKLGAATAAHLNHDGTIVIGHDTRPHSEKIYRALTSGAADAGLHVQTIGLSPTDKVAVCTSEWDADLGIMVTASHHAWQRTGCKYLYKKGHGFSNADMEQIKERYGDTTQKDGTIMERKQEANKRYKTRVTDTVKAFTDVLSNASIVADCGTGATSPFLPGILDTLGCDVTPRNTALTPDETLEPEPRQENRSGIREAVKNSDAALAVGTDPDGDRVYALDEHGEWIPGQELFTVLATLVDAETIAASLDTSAMLAAYTEANVVETRVGDIFVAAKAVEINADMYGEPNGHFAVPRFSWYPSGTFAGALLAANAHRIPEIRSEIPDYTTVRHTVHVSSNTEKTERMEDIIAYVEENYEVLSTVDGIKFAVDDGTVLIRPSGTTPKIRCIFEHKDGEQAEWMREIVVEELTTNNLL